MLRGRFALTAPRGVVFSRWDRGPQTMSDERRFCERCRGLGMSWRVRGGMPEIFPCPECFGKGHHRPRPRYEARPRRRPPRDCWGCEMDDD